MIRCSDRSFAVAGVATITALLFFASNVSAAVGRSAGTAANDPCALLTPGDIAKATSIKVGSGMAGKPMPGVLGRCTWTGEGNTRLILTLGDAEHIGLTIKAAEEAGSQSVAGVGAKAVGMKGADFTGGGYIVNVLDAKGGFGVSIVGKKGTRDRAIALSKIVEHHR